jgi:hypothetical protein
MIYEAVPKKRTDDRPADYEIRLAGAGKGTGKTCTVWGYHGVDVKAIATRIVEALNTAAPLRERKGLDDHF